VTVVCNPPSGSCFPLGVTTVTCTATDASGNTATCSFTITVFNGRLQDDFEACNDTVLFNTITGDYRWCCHGTIFTGKGKITRAGDEVLRRLLVAGATAVIQQVRNGRGRPSPWLLALLKRKPPKLAAVALANKIARIAWKLMTTGESYDSARMPGVSAFAA